MGSMQLKDIVRIQTASINPMDAPDKLFHLYSLPSFDENQKREEVYGHQIQSNKSIVPNKCRGRARGTTCSAQMGTGRGGQMGTARSAQ